MEIIFFFGILLISATVFGYLGDKKGIPRVALYIVTGALFSKELLGQFIYPHGDYWANEISSVALSFIGYQIGATLTFSDLRKNRKIYCVGAIGNAIGAVLFVAISIWLFGWFSRTYEVLKLSIALAAIAATTAPAGTMAVIKQYKTDGPVTRTLLGIVILDDVLGVLIFALMTGLATSDGWTQSLLTAGIETFLSVSFGCIIGMLFGKISKKLHHDGLFLSLLFGTIFLILALSDRWHLSTILVSMTTGISSRFITNNSNDSLESIEEGIYMILFILAGCHFQLSVFTTSIPLMIVYIISRSAGKYVGTYVGTSYAGATGKVRKYVGIGLIPQAGVAIGLTLLLAEMAPFENIKMTVLNLIIGATIIHEVLGPLLTKYALGKAGEISN